MQVRIRLFSGQNSLSRVYNDSRQHARLLLQRLLDLWLISIMRRHGHYKPQTVLPDYGESVKNAVYVNQHRFQIVLILYPTSRVLGYSCNRRAVMYSGCVSDEPDLSAVWGCRRTTACTRK